MFVGHLLQITFTSMNQDTVPAFHNVEFFTQQKSAMGSLHNIDFSVFWARWGGSRKEPGSGMRWVWKVGPRSNGF